MENLENFKVREFDWFQLETKIRTFVTELLQPVQRNSSEILQKLDQQCVEYKFTQDKFEYLNDLVTKTPKGQSLFTEINDRYQRLERSTHENNALIQHQLQEFAQTLDNFKYIQKKQATDYQNLIKQQDQNKENQQEIKLNFRLLSDNLLEITSKQHKRVDKIDAQYNADIYLLKNDIQTSYLQQQQQDNNQKLNSEKIVQYTKLQEKIQAKQITESVQIEEHTKQISNISGNLSVVKRFTTHMEDLQSEVKKMEQYIVQNIKLDIQTQISETLFSIFNQNDKQNLIKYDQKFFSDKKEEEGEVSLQQKMEESGNMVEKIFKRNKKYLNKLNSGGGSDSSQSDDDKENNNQQQSPKSPKKIDSQNLSQHYDASQVQKSSNSNSSEAYVQDIIQNLKQEVKLVISNHQQTTEKKLTIIQHNHEDFEQLINFQFDHQKNILDNSKQSHIEIKREIQMQASSTEIKFTNILMEIQKIASSFNVLSQTVHKILHFATIQNYIQIQEEVDKQTMGLYGIKDEIKMPSHTNRPKGDKKLPIQLDQKCLSCSGQNILIQSAFKQACLIYNPTGINIDGKQHNRDEVLKMLTQILQDARSEYQISNDVSFQEFAFEKNNEQDSPRTKSRIGQLQSSMIFNNSKTQHYQSLQASQNIQQKTQNYLNDSIFLPNGMNFFPNLRAKTSMVKRRDKKAFSIGAADRKNIKSQNSTDQK